MAPKALLGRGSWASRPRLAQGQLLLLSLPGTPNCPQGAREGLLCAEAIQNLSTGPLPWGTRLLRFLLSQEPRPILKAHPATANPGSALARGATPDLPARHDWGGGMMWPRDLAARPRPVKAGPGRGRSTRAPLPGRAGDQGAAALTSPPPRANSLQQASDYRVQVELRCRTWRRRRSGPAPPGPILPPALPRPPSRPGAPSALPGPAPPAASRLLCRQPLPPPHPASPRPARVARRPCALAPPLTPGPGACGGSGGGARADLVAGAEPHTGAGLHGARSILVPPLRSYPPLHRGCAAGSSVELFFSFKGPIVLPISVPG